MLQQTRLETVAPYYERWMERFPSVAALATASQQEVLSVWEGLGYYSRARNLQRAAQYVVENYGGQLPADFDLLRRLPGVGRYTAAAIASIAFGLDQPALDGNIRRVLARLFDVTEEARSSAGERRLWELAAQQLPPGRAGEYNQALMDLGATLCTPHAPDCHMCPLVAYCQAHALGVQEQRPVTRPRPAIPHYTVTAAVITRRDRGPEPLILIAQRPLEGILGGMWEFPGGKVQPGEDLPTCLRREISEELGAAVEVGEPLGVYRHAFTHFRITLHAFRCTLRDPEPHPNPPQFQERKLERETPHPEPAGRDDLHERDDPAPTGTAPSVPPLSSGELPLGRGRGWGNEPRPIQVADIRWVKIAELAAYPMGKIDRQISKRLNSAH
jgi:A/G-specific adenine glycosylase